MDNIHSLLKRQLRKFIGDSQKPSPDMQSLIEAVNTAYFDMDTDLRILERALDLSSEELLQASVELRTIFNTFPDLLLRVDQQGKILDYRGGTDTDSPLPREQVIGFRLTELAINGIAEKLQQAFLQAEESGNIAATEYSHTNQAGDEIFFEARFSPLSNGHAIAIIRNITKRKRAENALRSSERRMGEIIDFLPDPTFVVDLDGKIIAWNRATEQLTGLRTEDMIGKGSYEYSIPFRGTRTPVLIDYVLNQSDVPLDHYATFTKRGDTLIGGFFSDTIKPGGAFLWVKASPLFDSDGKVVGAIQIVRDITEFKKTERLLVDTGDRLRKQQETLITFTRSKVISSADLATSLGELTRAGGMTLDVDRVSTWVITDDQPELRCWGFYTKEGKEEIPSIEAIPLNSVSELLPILNAERVYAVDDVLADHYAKRLQELGIIHKNARSMLCVPIILNGKSAGAISYLQTTHIHNWTPDEESFARSTADLAALAIEASERKKMEDNLRIKTEAMNAASDQILITDSSGMVEFINPSYEREIGYTIDELREMPSFGMCAPESATVVDEIRHVITAGHTWHGEVTILRKDGSTVVEDVNITPVTNPRGQIEHYIAIHRNITDKKLYEQQLCHIAHHDSLTGLPNRLLFNDRLKQCLAQAARNANGMAVLFLDLDRFKQINDTLGHSAGDILLQSVSERLQNCIREADTIARMGGDEFTIILSSINSIHDVESVARRTVEALSAPFVLSGKECFVTVSVGIGVYPVDGNDIDTLIRNADTAMYRAKEQGRNNFQFYTQTLNTAAAERARLEECLRQAVEREEFVLNYQPRADLHTGKVVGAEALIRWNHPQMGTVSPARFIPLAEETGLIVPISEWVVRTACRQSKLWQESGIGPVTISINTSAKDLRQPDAISRLKQLIEEAGLLPEYLEMEITEDTLMQGADLAVGVMEQLKDIGVKLSIDNFGTGYSSLTNLKRFPIDSVKIDQSFIRNLTTNQDDAEIARAVVGMAHSLRLRVIAEGVETIEQLSFLSDLECDEVQGYYISRPITDKEFEKIMKEQRRLVDGAARKAS